MAEHSVGENSFLVPLSVISKKKIKGNGEGKTLKWLQHELEIRHLYNSVVQRRNYA